MPIMLEPFDPSRAFEARTFFRAGGKVYARHQEFDKNSVNARVLQQLYEQRRIAYSDGPPAPRQGPGRPSKRFGRLLAGFVGAVIRHSNSGASGTAREAPGAEESTSATSGSASAPSRGEGSPELPSPDETTEAAAQAPVEAEAAAAPTGDGGTAAAARQAKIDQLMIDHSQSQLIAMAEGMTGVNSKTPKAVLAAMLIDAGRGG